MTRDCHISTPAGVEPHVEVNSERALELPAAGEFDFEEVFDQQYARIARVVARLVQDPARAEEIAVDVFLKLHRNPKAQGPRAAGWLYRTAVRAGLDELRRRSRREKYERLARGGSSPPSPEQLYSKAELAARVQAVLLRIRGPQAGILVLRSEGASYQEIAETLELNPASVGTLLRRAGEAFRKEYEKRYGTQP
jgi:RNA polymerase sigma-70 factor (ECF subfamily)